MKQSKRKENLKKLLFIQHIVIWAIVCLGISFIITKTLASDGNNSRTQGEYITPYFWSQSPDTGTIFDALYSGQTAYTKDMSGYDITSCQKENMNSIIYSWWSFTILPEVIWENTLVILNSGTYVNTISQLTLSGNCIAIIGSGKVNFWGYIIRNNQTKYSIIDNIIYRNNSFSTKNYSNQTGSTVQIFSNATTNYEINWEIIGNYKTGIIQNQITDIPFEIEYTGNTNTLDIKLYDAYNLINHTKKVIIHDNTVPEIVAMLSGTSTPIIPWWIYNQGIKVDINEMNLSGITNNWSVLSGSSFLFINQWLYTLQATDKAGNTTWISFEIDTTAPSITNLQPSSGSTINTSILTLSRSTQENTTKIKSQIYYVYSGWSIILSWNIAAGITTKELPTINNWTYKRQIILEDTAGNISTGEASNIRFTKTPSIFIAPIAHQLNNKRYSNTDPIILLSGNKNFEYTIIRSGSIVTTGIYTWITKQENISIWALTGDISIQVPYKTEDNEIGTGIINMFIDKTIPLLSLQPLGKKINTTNPITYTRTGSKADNMIKYYNFLINDSVVYSWTNKYYTKTWLQANGIYIAQVRGFDIAGNIGQSTAETTIIDQIAPTIHNVTNNSLYKELPYPIIRDERNEPVQVTIRKNNSIIMSWIQDTPYVVGLEAGEFTYTITATDIAKNTTGVSFIIDTTPPTVSLTAPWNNTTISGNNSITFTWTGNDNNLSWFDFNLRSNSYGYFSTWIKTTNKTITVQNLNNGQYFRRVIAIDKAGNTTTSSEQSFIISVPLTGQIYIDWAVTIAYIQYVNSENIQLLTNINKPTIATITGDIIGEFWSQIINKELWAGSQTTAIKLTAGEWRKDIYVRLQDYVENNYLTSFQSVIIDKVAPSKPILTNINNQAFTGTAIITWTASTDNWAGVKEYMYQIEQNNQIKKSWRVTSSAITIDNMELWNQWTFLIKIKSVDNVGNQSDRSENAIFSYAGIPDTSPDNFTFSRQTNVKREKTYRSNSITITWLSVNTTVMASIDEWTLFLNGNDVDDRAMVKNGDVLYIELESSDEYDETTTSILTINDKNATFKLTTEEEDEDDEDDEDNDDDYNISDDEIEELEDTYELISILDDSLKLKFKEMLEDKIDELEDEDEDEDEIEKLRYIYDRVVEDINESKDIIYNAPNWKTYIIIYKKWVGYYSVNFSAANKNKVFTTMEEIKYFIDKNNQKTSLNYIIDTSRSTAKHTAPNGKVYNIFRTTNGQYSSYNMVVPKLFSTLTELKNHINKNNPRK